jgi:hypothetical protein
VGPWESNIQLWTEAGGPIVVEYSTAGRVRWAHGSSIFNAESVSERAVSPLQICILHLGKISSPCGVISKTGFLQNLFLSQCGIQCSSFTSLQIVALEFLL